MQPFQIHVPDEEITNLRRRLRDVRWLPEVPGSSWQYGIDLAFMQDLTAYWADGFDWREIESLLNGFPQFRTSLTAWNGEVAGDSFHPSAQLSSRRATTDDPAWLAVVGL